MQRTNYQAVIGLNPELILFRDKRFQGNISYLPRQNRNNHFQKGEQLMRDEFKKKKKKKQSPN